MKKSLKNRARLAESATSRAVGAALLSAAITLPLAGAAHADIAPERGIISIKNLNYQESQPGEDRIHVDATSVMVMTPIAGKWSVSGTFTTDTISGASPAYYTSYVTKTHDHRSAFDADVTRYFQDATISVAANISSESDYLSRGVSTTASKSSEDKNTTWTAGIAFTRDRINPNNNIVSNEYKNTNAVIFGVSQVLTPKDIVQMNLGLSQAKGYFSDPYKNFDKRPRDRNNNTIMTRWNHYFESTEGTTHISYRYYTDSWSVKAHTLGAEYVQPFANGWTVTPLVRIHSQTAANFYVEAPPVITLLFVSAPNSTYYSEDQRVSAFGAHTLGLKITKKINSDWIADLKYESYQQRASYTLSGSGSQNLAPFDARSIQVGLSRLF